VAGRPIAGAAAIAPEYRVQGGDIGDDGTHVMPPRVSTAAAAAENCDDRKSTDEHQTYIRVQRAARWQRRAWARRFRRPRTLEPHRERARALMP
jgi:predicted transcriptional regulator